MRRTRLFTAWIATVVAVLGAYVLFAAVVAGCVTALIVVILGPPTLVLVFLFAALTMALTLAALRSFARNGMRGFSADSTAGSRACASSHFCSR